MNLAAAAKLAEERLSTEVVLDQEWAQNTALERAFDALEEDLLDHPVAYAEALSLVASQRARMWALAEDEGVEVDERWEPEAAEVLSALLVEPTGWLAGSFDLDEGVSVVAFQALDPELLGVFVVTTDDGVRYGTWCDI